MHGRWLENAARRGVARATIDDIVRRHDIGPADFAVLDGLDEITDPLGASFFVLPADIGPVDARRAVLMTYVLDAGTGYGATSPVNDVEETPYSAAEVQRILERQAVNDWTYARLVPLVHRAGGRMVTTPHGTLMGLGGNRLLGLFAQRGGTTYGDLFLLNIRGLDDPVAELREVVVSGRSRHQRKDSTTYAGRLALGRLLHHEERHSQQWGDAGPIRFVVSYAWERVRRRNDTEEDAGLGDGGYR
ncbi:hypothetical protein [Aeromicrobium endophyticum]|uniref:Uncharacterized protein n=1 Tax=Aeromicrobium endophyticum TaxID=2292704 RepID=A0A371PA26_9ACTN|nr:hypothetical protein [Aeromicrobium endophyticum]REK72789.1 hypothetical protein DX116_04090 [Aeromicrobium endophyticum]